MRIMKICLLEKLQHIITFQPKIFIDINLIKILELMNSHNPGKVRREESKISLEINLIFIRTI